MAGTRRPKGRFRLRGAERLAKAIYRLARVTPMGAPDVWPVEAGFGGKITLIVGGWSMESKHDSKKSALDAQKSFRYIITVVDVRREQ